MGSFFNIDGTRFLIFEPNLFHRKYKVYRFCVVDKMVQHSLAAASLLLSPCYLLNSQVRI
jgi:hypothetical protein